MSFDIKNTKNYSPLKLEAALIGPYGRKWTIFFKGETQMWSEKRVALMVQIALLNGQLMALERLTFEIDKQRREIEALLEPLKEQKKRLTEAFS